MGMGTVHHPGVYPAVIITASIECVVPIADVLTLPLHAYRGPHPAEQAAAVAAIRVCALMAVVSRLLQTQAKIYGISNSTHLPVYPGMPTSLRNVSRLLLPACVKAGKISCWAACAQLLDT
jgi:hypothetical protein